MGRAEGRCAMTHLLDYLADRVLLCDGPIGTQVQGRNLDIERDFHGHENCTDILCDSRPEVGVRLGPHFYNTDDELRFAVEQIAELAAVRTLG